MGANKTSKAIKRLSVAEGGIMEIVNKFDLATGIEAKSSSHSHKSSLKDENIIISDHLRLKPFEIIDGRQHEGFPAASSDTLSTLNYEAFHEWLKRHKRNFLKHVPVDLCSKDEDEIV